MLPNILSIPQVRNLRRLPVVHIRMLSTNGHNKSISAPGGRPSVPVFIHKFNESISENVFVTVPVFFGIRNLTWYALLYGVSHTLSCGPELGIAYLVTKFTKQFRQFLNIALSPVLSHQFPLLQSIKASALFGALPPLPAPDKNGSTLTSPLSPLIKAAHWISGPLDKYGFSYYLASKVTRVASITGTALLLRSGIDMTGLLTSLGVGDVVQDAAGAMGLASLLNVMVLPVHLLFITHALPVINHFGRTIADSARGPK